MKLPRYPLLLLLLLMPALCSAASWWNGEWQYRKEIGFDLSPGGADIAGTNTQVPVLIRLSVANFAYFADAKPDGSDFRVIDGDDKTPLKFFFERYDSKDQLAYLWVQVPTMTGGSKTQKIYVYYGNSGASAAADAPGTFDVNQTLLLGFGETSGLPLDSTAYKNNATASSAEQVPASLIAGGVKFAGGQAITVPASASLRLLPSQGLTLSAWVKIDQPQAQADLLSLADGPKEIMLGIDGTHAFARYAGAGAPVIVTQSGAALATGQWHLLALTAGAGQLTLYVDGVPAGRNAVTLEEIGGTLSVGGSTHASNYLSAEVDQVSVAKVERSADWIKAEARNEGTEAPLTVYGSDDQKESGGQGSYFSAIAKNLTVDGWVVIVICLSMLFIALVIMFLKALYLGQVEKHNARFLREYQQLAVAGDAGALDQPTAPEAEEFAEASPAIAALLGEEGKYGASTLYRLYHMGIAELNKRRAGNSAGARRAALILSPQAIEAIRASMDATLVRLQQRMSSQMVLLTIAISGGPFLGLLGTVIGVMITFAAIALSGDVNINAIAPGTAAALAATVAGLAVAIPSLFGYNWLNTRIKAINANNRVFLDEFVARLAEQYS